MIISLAKVGRNPRDLRNAQVLWKKAHGARNSTLQFHVFLTPVQLRVLYMGLIMRKPVIGISDQAHTQTSLLSYRD